MGVELELVFGFLDNEAVQKNANSVCLDTPHSIPHFCIGP